MANIWDRQTVTILKALSAAHLEVARELMKIPDDASSKDVAIASAAIMSRALAGSAIDVTDADEREAEESRAKREEQRAAERRAREPAKPATLSNTGL